MSSVRPSIRRCWPLAAIGACVAAASAVAQPLPAAPQKVLRYSMEKAETGFDPRLHSVAYAELLGDDIVGLQALRERAQHRDLPFDYDAPVEGLRVIDRYTLRVRFGHPSPRFPLKLAESVYAGAVAREVADLYGDAILEHPVGTGPYRLAQWRRSSFIALERNPRFRDEFYDEQPAADDIDGQATAATLHGRRDTLVDLMLGKSTLAAALAEADAAATDRLRAGQRCEAEYYVAEQLLAHGQDLPANRLLEQAHAVCPSNYIEADAIVAEQGLQAARIARP